MPYISVKYRSAARLWCASRASMLAALLLLKAKYTTVQTRGTVHGHHPTRVTTRSPHQLSHLQNSETVQLPNVDIFT